MLVMITCLQKIYSIIPYEVDDSMLQGKAPRACAGSEIFERFRFADAGKRIFEDSLYEIKRPQRNASVRLRPVAQVFHELRLKNRITTHPKSQSPGAIPLSFEAPRPLQALD